MNEWFGYAAGRDLNVCNSITKQGDNIYAKHVAFIANRTLTPPSAGGIRTARACSAYRSEYSADITFITYNPDDGSGESVRNVAY